jgi:hypothetical protein
MPAPREFLEPVRSTGLPKIKHGIEAQPLSAAASEIATAAEISVHLPHKRICPDQVNPEVRLSELATKGRIRQECAISVGLRDCWPTKPRSSLF